MRFYWKYQAALAELNDEENNTFWKAFGKRSVLNKQKAEGLSTFRFLFIHLFHLASRLPLEFGSDGADAF